MAEKITYAGNASIFDEVGDSDELELRIVSGEKVEYKSKKKDEGHIMNLAWKFSALLRDEETGDVAKNEEDKEIWINFSVFFGKKDILNPENSALNFQYVKFRDILFPDYDEVDKASLKGSELLKAILKQKNFLIELAAGVPFTSDKGVEYANYSVRNIQATMLEGGSDEFTVSDDEVIGLWDE